MRNIIRTLQLSFICASFLISGCAITSPQASSNIDRNSTPQEKIAPVNDKTWVLVWDDKVDDSLDVPSKSCRLHLDFGGKKVSGRFDGLVLGVPRDAHFTGKLVHSDKTSLLLLQQDEKDYTCVYEMQALGNEKFMGVWHDTLGRKGDVELNRASSSDLLTSKN